MSHFLTYIFTHSDPEVDTSEIDELLAPYYEELEVDRYEYRTYDSVLKEIESSSTIKEDDSPDMIQWKKNQYERLSSMTEKEKILFWIGAREEDLDDEKRVIYSSYNPNSKWDWYSFGGRFCGEIKTLDGKEVNCCKANEMDLAVSKKTLKYLSREWDVVAEGSPMTEEEKTNLAFWGTTKDELLNCYGSKEAYLEANKYKMPFAYVTSDGEWHEASTMGWFALHTGKTKDSATKYPNEYVKYVKEHGDEYVTVVDCHI